MSDQPTLTNERLAALIASCQGMLQRENALKVSDCGRYDLNCIRWENVIQGLTELQDRRAADSPIVSIEARKLIDDGRFNTSIVSIYDW